MRGNEQMEGEGGEVNGDKRQNQCWREGRTEERYRLDVSCPPMRQSELGLGGLEDDKWMKKRSPESLQDLFYSLFPEIPSPPPLSQKGRQERERVHQEVTKEERQKKKKKSREEKLPRQKRASFYLHVCFLNSSLPQQKAIISFLFAKKLVSWPPLYLFFLI